MRHLTERERTIVTSRFGLFGLRQPLTLAQLGRAFGLSKERIRQIEHRAVDRIRDLLAPHVCDRLLQRCGRNPTR